MTVQRTIATLIAGKLDPAQDRHAYEEGTWTPVIDFPTRGDLGVTYAANGQIGTYTRIGNRVFWTCVVVTATFTHTTAAGNLAVTGLPYVGANIGRSHQAAGAVNGYTKAGYTQITPAVASSGAVNFGASGSGVPNSALAATDLPSGTNLVIWASGHYSI